MPKTLDLDEITCNAAALRKASRRTSQFYDAALAPTGLRATQMAILARLYRLRDDPPTMSQLAEAMVLDRSALGHNLRPLERDGLIELRENPADRRHRNIHLTRSGRARLAKAHPLWKQAQDRLNTLLGKAHMKRLREALLAIAYDDRLKGIDLD